MLYSRLSHLLHTHLIEPSDERYICDVRAYCPEMPMRRDYLYVQETGELSSVLLLREKEMALVAASFCRTLNSIIEIIEQFKAIAGISYQIFNRPIMITSNVFKCWASPEKTTPYPEATFLLSMVGSSTNKLLFSRKIQVPTVYFPTRCKPFPRCNPDRRISWFCDREDSRFHYRTIFF